MLSRKLQLEPSSVRDKIWVKTYVRTSPGVPSGTHYFPCIPYGTMSVPGIFGFYQHTVPTGLPLQYVRHFTVDMEKPPAGTLSNF